MAYNKKTWLARLGQGLNKFSIDGATPVPIINQPDSVTQQGDALSAGNLNDLEQRIADAFDDVEESKADKSTTDALQSQINQQDARIENLEQKAGDYSIVQYRGTDAVPTGKASYGLVKNIVGKSRAWNQYFNNIVNFGTITGTVSDYSITFTSSETSGYVILRTGSKKISQGHKFAVLSNNSKALFQTWGNGYLDWTAVSGGISRIDGSLTTANFIGTCNGDINGILLNVDAIASGDVLRNIKIRDLTLIFGAGNEPSTVKEALAQLPALGQYNDYDAGSLVDTEVSGVKFKSMNIIEQASALESVGLVKNGDYWVGSTFLGSITTGIEFKKNTQYTISYKGKVSASAVNFRFRFQYDDGSYSQTSYITSTSEVSIRTTSTSGKTISSIIGYYGDAGTVYLRDLQIVEGVSSEQYHPYKTDTLSLSETVTLRGVGTCVETLDVETGVRDDGKFELVDLGSLDWTYSDGFRTPISDLPSAPKKTDNNICPLYKILRSSSGLDKEGYFGTSNLVIRDSSYTDAATFKNAMSGVYLMYEKETYTPSSPITPVPDNFIEVEGGGTIDTIQEQTPIIDNCLDVGYLTL